MKILLDFISIQGYVNGGAEHAKKVYDAMFELYANNEYIALYDSKINFAGNDKSLYDAKIVEWVDINTIGTIAQYVSENNIEIFYIGIFQRYFSICLDNIPCRVVVVIHDILDVELAANNIYMLYKPFTKSLLRIADKLVRHLPDCSLLKKIENHVNPILSYDRCSSFLCKRNVSIITVSEFSKNSILYNFPSLRKKDIRIFYAPHKITPQPTPNDIVEKLIDQNKKVFLLLNADRYTKNVGIVTDVLKGIEDFTTGNCYLVTTGIKENLFSNHIPLNFVSAGELEYIYSKATALLYPSVLEGFGYPPVEAMKYGTPVICSNTSSIPEVVGDVGLYFSPFFRSDFYRVITSFIKAGNIDKVKIKERAQLISKKQEEDLIGLVDFIMNQDLIYYEKNAIECL